MLIFGLICFLSGCTRNFAPPSSIGEDIGHENPKHTKKLVNLKSWCAEGKFMANSESQALHASFLWQQNGPYYKIKFFGPLGMSAGELVGSLDSLEVEFRSSSKTLRATSPEKLVYQATGLDFPVSNLSYWIKGLAKPDYPIEKCLYNSEGFLKELKQDTWEVLYHYHAPYKGDEGLYLPRLLKIKNKQINLKIAINSWS